MRDYGYYPPLESAGLVRYDTKWEKKRWNYAAIFDTRGEDRLSNTIYPQRCEDSHKSLWSDFLFSVASWIGFSLRVFRDIKMNLEQDAIHRSNMVCYRVNDGYGFFITDHEDSVLGEPLSESAVNKSWAIIEWDVMPPAYRRHVNMGRLKQAFSDGLRGRCPEPTSRNVVEVALSK